MKDDTGAGSLIFKNKQTEEITSDEQRLSALIRATSDVIYRMSPDGSSLTELDGKGFLTDTRQPNIKWLDQYVYPEDQECVTCKISECIRERKMFELEHRVLKADGSIGWIYSKAVPLIDDSGKIKEWFGAASDITQRKKMEEELRQNEQRFRTITESTPDHIVAHDRELRYTLVVNPQLGLTEGDMIGKTDYDILSKEEADRLTAFKRKVLETGTPLHMEDSFVSKDGQEQFFDGTIIPQFDEDRICNGVIGYFRNVTDQKKVERAFRESESRYRRMFETTNEGVFAADKDFNITLVNKKFGEMTGYSQEELVGSRVASFLFEEDVPNLLKNRKRREQGLSDVFEKRFRRKDGTTLWFHTSATPIMQDGDYLGSFMMVTDITERKATEEALRTSKIQLSDAMDLAHIAYWEFDPIAKTYIFNDPFYALYGTNVELEGGYRMAIDQYAKRFVHPGDQALFYNVLRQSEHIDSELRPDTEHRILRGNGEIRHILVRTRVIRDELGHSVKIYGANQDITERKETEEALHRSEEKFKKAFYTSPDAININRLTDGMYISSNQGFFEIMGYSEDDVKGRTSIDLDIWVNPDDRARLLKGLREHGKVENLEAPFRAKDGRKVFGLMSATIIVLEGVPHILSITRDMTLRRQSEQEKEQLKSQLTQAQKMEAIGTLAGGIAHDFNNLLSVIGGFTSLLQKSMSTSDPKRAYADQVLAASEKAAQLTQGLLAFSRKQQLSLMPLSMNEVIKNTSKLLKRLITDDIELKLELSEQNPIIKADVSMIDQILFNLAANARDAMPNGGNLTIATELKTVDEQDLLVPSGQYMLIRVSDTGSGIDEETREKIFEPFFTTKEVGKGTGLGLSTVYGIVKQHDGYINVDSELGKGTTFNLYFPVVDEVVLRKEIGYEPDVEAGNETILVAEDNVGVRILITQVLKDNGYTIIEATDGKEAVAQFQRTPDVDLLIFDSVMPGKNGREAYEEIRIIKPDAKIIFTSGYTRDVFSAKGIEETDYNFLSKPIKPDVLLRMVRDVLNSAGEF